MFNFPMIFLENASVDASESLTHNLKIFLKGKHISDVNFEESPAALHSLCKFPFVNPRSNGKKTVFQPDNHCLLIEIEKLNLCP